MKQQGRTPCLALGTAQQMGQRFMNVQRPACIAVKDVATQGIMMISDDYDLCL